ncbi:DUF805 domain-containing protein [Acidithiobacillus sulfuriphilus]|uniref:DUF805 domain-containing protein n=1 Tax=Acidithiobacillus sulfuriphilus TaxID=1867749 RepID=UPI003F62AAA4
MRMISAFKNIVMNNYANFHVRLGRAEFWWFYLMNFLISVAIGILVFLFTRTLEYVEIAMVAYALITLLPLLPAEVRRFHDVGISGWWLLLAFIPYLGAIAILVLLILPAKPTGERFGPYTDNPNA